MRDLSIDDLKKEIHKRAENDVIFHDVIHHYKYCGWTWEECMTVAALTLSRTNDELRKHLVGVLERRKT